jgi:ferredoxin-NADP reductase/DNA-binding transcriptional regulator YhcF (GntR family)
MSTSLLLDGKANCIYSEFTMNSYAPELIESNAQSRAFDFIKEEILSMRLRPMQRLNAGELALQLGMSRTPVREALSRLQQESLVARDVGGGFSVRSITLGEILDFYRVREALEVEAALEALPHMNAQRLATLESLLRTAKSLLHPSKYAEFVLAAGQFAALQFPGVEGTRCYSMVNSASPTRHLDFVIKRKPGGGVSEWMFNVNRSAQEIDLFGPAGKATYDPDAPGDILCIAGGSGVAGMMSILRRAAENSHFHRHSGHLFFGLRKAADSFFLQELNELARAYPESLHVTVAMSDEAAPQELRASYPALAFESGLVHEVAGVKLQSALKNVRAFVAGPPLAVSATLRMMMLQLKVSATSIKYDNFG